MFVPMLIQEDPVGLIVAVNKIEGDRFSDGDLRLAEAFADPAAIALDSSERAARGTPHRPQTSRVTRQSDLRGRETEVLRLVALGLSNAEVAERLVVSPRTVHAHLRSIYRKLELTSRGAATRYAFEHDLI
jgi:DNA-binding NarL/FixJ family response regulator